MNESKSFVPEWVSCCRKGTRAHLLVNGRKACAVQMTKLKLKSSPLRKRCEVCLRLLSLIHQVEEPVVLFVIDRPSSSGKRWWNVAHAHVRGQKGPVLCETTSNKNQLQSLKKKWDPATPEFARCRLCSTVIESLEVARHSAHCSKEKTL